MKKPEAVILAEEETRRAWVNAAREVAVQVMKSPAMQMIIGVAIVELGQMIRPDGEHQLITDLTGSAIETSLISGEAIKALGQAAQSFKVLS